MCRAELHLFGALFIFTFIYSKRAFQFFETSAVYVCIFRLLIFLHTHTLQTLSPY